MGNKNSGKHPGEANLLVWRAFWFGCGRNNAKTARQFKVNQKTIAVYRKDRQWDRWADDVIGQADKISVRPQAERVADLLNLCDIRAKAITSTAQNPAVPGSVAAEINHLAKTSQLLTGGATDRLDTGAFLREFDAADEDAKLAIIARLRERDGGRSGAADGDTESQPESP